MRISTALIEEKIGAAWRIDPGAGAGPLSDVSCASPTQCVAVGFRAIFSPEVTL